MLEYLINQYLINQTKKLKKKERSKQQQKINGYSDITTKKHVDGISISETKDVINKNI